ncbi:MAG: hypothetical protein ACC662_12160, partial [Planctomycetota bacterium]
RSFEPVRAVAGRIRTMPSPQSLRRLANVTKKVHDDLRRGGMGMTFRYLFRSTAILARVTAILADYIATEAGAPPAQENPEATKHALRVDLEGEKPAGAPETDA